MGGENSCLRDCPETYVVVRHLSFRFTPQQKTKEDRRHSKTIIRYQILEKCIREPSEVIAVVREQSERKMQGIRI